VKLPLFSAQIELSCRGLLNAEEYLHERRFPRAVFADDGVNLTVPEIDGDILVCDNTVGVDLCDVFEP
jgi:hypothetical protein